MQDNHPHWNYRECPTCNANSEDTLEKLHIEHVQLRGMLYDYLASLGARQQLDSGFRGMGYNIAQEKAAQLNYHLSNLKKLLGVV